MPARRAHEHCVFVGQKRGLYYSELRGVNDAGSAAAKQGFSRAYSCASAATVRESLRRMRTSLKSTASSSRFHWSVKPQGAPRTCHACDVPLVPARQKSIRCWCKRSRCVERPASARRSGLSQRRARRHTDLRHRFRSAAGRRGRVYFGAVGSRRITIMINSGRPMASGGGSSSGLAFLFFALPFGIGAGLTM